MSRRRGLGLVLALVACGGASSTPVEGPPPSRDGGAEDGGAGTDSGGSPASDAGAVRDAGGGDPGLVCDETSDCNGQVCCAELSLNGPVPERSLETRCMPSCITGLPRYQVCRQESECESRECRAFDCGPRARGLRFCERPDFCR